MTFSIAKCPSPYEHIIDEKLGRCYCGMMRVPRAGEVAGESGPAEPGMMCVYCATPIVPGHNCGQTVLALRSEVTRLQSQEKVVSGMLGSVALALGMESDATLPDIHQTITRLTRERDEWKNAIIDAAVVDWVYTEEHETNPRKAISDLLGWQQRIALDPKVSAPTAKLVERAEAAEAQVKEMSEALRQIAEGKLELDVEEDGRFIADFPETPGALQYGETVEEAISRARALVGEQKLT